MQKQAAATNSKATSKAPIPSRDCETGWALQSQNQGHALQTCWESERTLPSGSLNQATLSPPGAVQMPSSGSWMNGYFSNATPRLLSQATTDSIFCTSQPRMVNAAGVDSLGTLAMRILLSPARTTRAKGSSLTNRKPSLPS